MRRFVVDTNFLREPELEDYLSKAKKNYVVVPDYVAMEMYKKNSLQSLVNNLVVLSKFPNQVLILKSTSKIVYLKGKKSGLIRRMIDQRQTAHFPKFCKDVELARSGHVGLQLEMKKHEDAAAAFFENQIRELDGIGKVYSDISAIFTPNEVSEITKDADYSDKLVRKILDHALLTTQEIFAFQRHAPKFFNAGEFANTFVFRAAFVEAMNLVRWIKNGSAGQLSARKQNNTMVDNYLIAYSTYFDGLLTNDRRQRELFQIVYPLLKTNQKACFGYGTD